MFHKTGGRLMLGICVIVWAGLLGYPGGAIAQDAEKKTEKAAEAGESALPLGRVVMFNAEHAGVSNRAGEPLPTPDA